MKFRAKITWEYSSSVLLSSFPLGTIIDDRDREVMDADEKHKLHRDVRLYTENVSIPGPTPIKTERPDEPERTTATQEPPLRQPELQKASNTISERVTVPLTSPSPTPQQCAEFRLASDLEANTISDDIDEKVVDTPVVLPLRDDISSDVDIWIDEPPDIVSDNPSYAYPSDHAKIDERPTEKPRSTKDEHERHLFPAKKSIDRNIVIDRPPDDGANWITTRQLAMEDIDLQPKPPEIRNIHRWKQRIVSPVKLSQYKGNGPGSETLRSLVEVIAGGDVEVLMHD
jgi:hypothetical protein